jgi:hypothetical protein
VILIAVTLAIGVAIAAWIMGIWGGMGGTESLKILPNSTLTVNNDRVTLELTIKNEGSRDAKIVGVEVMVGAGACKLTPGNELSIISAGAMVTGTATATGTCSGLTPGASYTVRVITEAGNVYQTMLVAYASPSS